MLSNHSKRGVAKRSIVQANQATSPVGDQYWDNVSLLIDGESATSKKGPTGTMVGNTSRSTAQARFGSQSMFLDGTGDYITFNGESDFAFGTADFTVEMWVYRTASAAQIVFDTRPSGGNGAYPTLWFNGNCLYYMTASVSTQIVGTIVVATGSWAHIALSRASGVTRIFVNGIQDGSSYTDAGNYINGASRPIIGADGNNPNVNVYTGYIDDIRVTKGVARYIGNFIPPTSAHPTYPLVQIAANTYTDGDPYWDQVVLAMDMNTLTDKKGKAVAAFGNAAISSVQSKFGDASCYFDGTGDYLTLSDSSSDFALGTGDFTIECWVALNSTATDQHFVGYNKPTIASGNDVGFVLGHWITPNRLFCYYYSGVTPYTIELNVTPSAGRWYHLAATRLSGVLYFFVDGVLIGTTAMSVGINNPAGSVLQIGRNDSGTPRSLNGYIDDVRITKGIARYRTSFSVPTRANPTYFSAPLLSQGDPYYGNTALLMNFDSPSGSTVFLDDRNNAVTTFGNTVARRNVSTGYAIFDGTGDYLTVGSTSTFAWMHQGVEPWTMECWLQSTSTNNTALLDTCNSGSAGIGTYLFMNITTRTIQAVIANGGGGAYPVVASSGSGVPTDGAWHHIAATFNPTLGSGGQIQVFIDGVLGGTGTKSGAAYSSSSTTSSVLTIGSQSGGSLYQLTGNVAMARITRGLVRYTQNFIPPISPLPNYQQTTVTPSTGGDPYWNNVVALLNMDGPNGSTSFKEETGKAVTVNGDTVIRRLPAGGGMAYFDATGDYLTIGNSSDFDFGTGDFTVELWTFTRANSGTRTIFCINQKTTYAAVRLSYSLLDLTLDMANAAGNAWLYQSGSVATTLQNTWQHIAVTRSNGVTKIWLNGTELISTASASAALMNVSPTFGVMLGAGLSGGSPEAGSMKNFRITKGIARYTTNFTPPTSFPNYYSAAPLPVYGDLYWDYVTLLMHCERADYYDEREQIPTFFGNLALTTTAPKFGTRALTFDGTGDYATFPTNANAYAFGTADYTVECFVKVAASNGRATLIGYITGGGGAWSDLGWTIYLEGLVPSFQAANSGGAGISVAGTTSLTVNTWNHLAVVRAGGTTTLYLNGVAGVTSSTTHNVVQNASFKLFLGSGYTVGVALNGVMDEIRITKGAARYLTNFAPPTAPFEQAPWSGVLAPVSYDAIPAVPAIPHIKTFIMQNGVMKDSMGNRTPTLFGNTTSSTAQYKLGSASMYFDGTGDYMTYAYDAGFAFGSGDFTVECWFYQTAATAAILLSNNNNVTITGWEIYTQSGNVKCSLSSDGSTWNIGDTTIGAVALNTWHHVAVSRQGTSIRYFLNGSLATTVTSALAISMAGTPHSHGARSNGSAPYTGYIDGVRITKGTSRYNASFVPPATPYITT
jgi:hypothetical protein